MDNANVGMPEHKCFFGGKITELAASRFVVMIGGEMIKINGEDLNIDGKTLAEYLTSANYNLQQIAVERNGEIVPKALYGETVLADGDVLEVVNFVGGG